MFLRPILPEEITAKKVKKKFPVFCKHYGGINVCIGKRGMLNSDSEFMGVKFNSTLIYRCETFFCLIGVKLNFVHREQVTHDYSIIHTNVVLLQYSTTTKSFAQGNCYFAPGPIRLVEYYFQLYIILSNKSFDVDYKKDT